MDKIFSELIQKALELDYQINPEMVFSQLPEWDSLSQLSLIAELDTVYNITIDTKDLNQISTIQDLYEEVMKRVNNG
jgi:acyl carrier protein